MPTTEEILKKYGAKIEAEINPSMRDKSGEEYSKEYMQFKQDMIPEISRYERWAKSIGSIINIKVSEKDRIKIQRFLNIAHLDATANQALTLSLMSLIGVFLLTLLISVAIYLINGSIQILFGFLGLVTSLFVFYYTYTMPKRLANVWRLKASSQMVPAVLYVVIYMKHTSNLERAVAFASEHLEGPLALDFKKIFYDVEIGRFSTIKQSLDNYLESWRDYSPEFVEAFHLVESSLFEPSESRRILILEKSLQVILDGIYEKMLKFSREIRSPLTNIYMLGIILPTLALALLPLASTLLGGTIKWQHILVIFNVIIPFFVLYMISEALLKRPGGYGESSILELNPDYDKYRSRAPWFKGFFFALPLFIIGIIPFLLQIPGIASILGLQSDYMFKDIGIGFLGDIKFFDFSNSGGKTIGPFGPLAGILSLFIPLSVTVFFSVAYSAKTKDLIKAREGTKELEEEFTNSLFQLGNRLGDGTPAEMAFSRVAESTQGQRTQQFFSLVSQNIQQLGMSIESAIFDRRRGAMIFFPSELISTSMKILVESVKKGLKVAAESLMSISEYVKNIEKINQRLRDLLAEIVSDMKSNMVFLAPLLAGIVVGLGGMITLILVKLKTLQEINPGGDIAGLGNLSSITSIFDVTSMIPPYFLQITVGVYLIEVIFILSGALVTVDSGKDELKEKYDLSKNLSRGMILYIITAFISISALTLLASIALRGLG